MQKPSFEIIPRLASIAIVLLCVVSTRAQNVDSVVRRELLTLERSLNDAVKRGDTTTLKQIVAREFQLTAPKGMSAVTVDKWLANALQWSFDSASHNEISVTNWENVAVFRSLQYFYNLKVGKGERVEKSPGSWVTDLWVRRDGRWQLVTRISERLAAK